MALRRPQRQHIHSLPCLLLLEKDQSVNVPLLTHSPIQLTPT